MAKSKRLKDVNQLAKSILDIATGETEDTAKLDDVKNPAAVALDWLGGKAGGKARANSLTAERRREIAAKAAAKKMGQINYVSNLLDASF